MHLFTLTIRSVGAELRVVAETSEPGQTGIRAEETLNLDRSTLREFPNGLDEIRQYGIALGEAVFWGGVVRAFERSQKGADLVKTYSQGIALICLSYHRVKGQRLGKSDHGRSIGPIGQQMLEGDRGDLLALRAVRVRRSTFPRALPLGTGSIQGPFGASTDAIHEGN